MRQLIFLFFAVISSVSCKTSKFPEVTLFHNGKVGGKTLQSFDGRDFFAFQGIPYGKPPVGELRFKAPEPAESWSGVLDATREASPCAQVPLNGAENFVGSEDCLYLNVYTPKLPSKENREKLPVLFWVHSGGFYAGNGGMDENGPEFLMDEDVILVTINYRLGPFGFLSSGDQKIPGNFGLKDQALALTWVQDNIEFFNGDRDRVTLWGYRAGGASVEAHLFSPQSSGLFSNAIYQSGSLANECLLQAKPALILQVLNSIVKCDEHFKIEDQLECLRKVPASDLAKAVNNFPSWGQKIPLAFSVVQELPNHLDGSWVEEPFLPENPNHLLAEGRIINDVPTITGLVKNEAAALGNALKQNPDLLGQADKSFKDVSRLAGCLFTMKPKKVAKIKKFYFEDKRINEKQTDRFLEFVSDSMWNWGQVSTALKQAKAAKSSVYFYEFTFEGRISEATASGLKPLKGVAHVDDLAYILRRRVPFPDGQPDERERNTLRRMTGFLANFARTGNPNVENNELFPVEWEPVESENFKYLEIDEELTMREGYPFKERMEFWERLTKKKPKVEKEEL